MNEVIIIGGGASGMMAAIVAARRGSQVVILERLNRIGKKILVTGNGRCNISNTKMGPEYFHTSGEVDLSFPINAFGYEETKNFFSALGIEPLVEGSKVYPLSEQANSVVDVMRMELARLDVNIIPDTKVTDLKKIKTGWQVMTETGVCYEAQKVIVATGGMANTGLGCDGLGYTLLKKLGHHMENVYPALVHVLSASPYCKMMKGTKIKANVSAYVDHQLARTEYGEVLFTEDGLSGPPIFQISRHISEAHIKGKTSQVTLDLFPNISMDEMVTMLYNRIALHPERTIEELFIGMLHKRIVVPVIKCAGIAAMHRNCDTLEYEEVEAIAKVLKGFPFETEGTRGYKFAQVTAGGICLDEVDLKTMASLKAEYLYITGEVLDVVGDCGGYNLQWAWATGYLAGLSCSKGNEGQND